MDDLKNLMASKKPLIPSGETNQGAAKPPATGAPVPRGFFDDGKVRPEYNFAKFADKIFLPHQSKRLQDTRTIPEQPRLFRDPDENPNFDPLCITIEPKQGGKTGSTTTWKILLGLIRLWELREKPADGILTFSLRELAIALGLKVSGNFSDIVRRELSTLKTTTYTWEYAFIDENGDTVELIDEMNVLANSTYIHKKFRKDHNRFDVINSVTFNNRILKNLLSGRTIPVDFDAFITIKSGTSLSLYSHLCTVLSNKSYYERKAINLFKDLELEGKKYESKRTRKEKLNELIESINGKTMANGKLDLSIKETADGTDWKLAARKIPKKANHTLPWPPVNDNDIIAELTKEITSVTGQGDSIDNWKKLSTLYNATLIRQAISEFKADIDPKEIDNAGKMFNAIVHRLAHRNGKEWIKKCGNDCRYRAL